MCGIVGIIGKKDFYGELKELLSNISYRGYDSCGMSTLLYWVTKEYDPKNPDEERFAWDFLGIFLGFSWKRTLGC